MCGERLLVVEDNRTTASIMQLKLRKLGYDVSQTAQNSEEAIELAETIKPRIVLMDIALGSGKDGIETASILKDRFNIPVVFVTSHSDQQTLARAKSTSPLGYINKPLRDTDIRTTLELALENLKIAQGKDSPRQRADDNTVLSQSIEIDCDQSGAIQDINLGTRHAMKSLEIAHAEELLPYNHRQIIEYALRIGNSYLVAGRLMDRIFSWEYLPNNVNNTVKVICEDLTHDRNLSHSHSNEEALKQTLNYLSIGVMLINQRLEPTFINQAAKLLLTRDPSISIVSDVLTLATPGLDEEFSRLVNDGHGGMISMNKFVPSSSTELLISPIENHNQDKVDTLPVSILYIFHGQKDEERFAQILKGLYGFTNAEARLASALVQDPRLEQAANIVGIKISTARSHLKKIFQKTGTDRQSSLINQIVSGPAGLILKLDSIS